MEDVKQMLATSCRLLEAIGFIDFSGHVSCRLDDTTFLINSHGKSRLEVGPEDMVTVNLDGLPVQEDQKVPSEVYIHSAVYQARKDVNAVAHLHSPAVISLSIARQAIFPAIFQGSLFADGIPIYKDARHVNTSSRGAQLAKILGDAKVAVIRAHGSVVVADNLKALFFFCVYFEKNAQRLLEAYASGTPEPLSPEALDEGKSGLLKERIINKVWDYYVSKLNVS